MARKQSEVLSEELEILRSEIKVITDNDEATEDEVARSEALLEEWKAKEALRQKALKREADVDEVMRAALNPGNRENANDRRGPEVKRNVDPFESVSMTEIVRSVERGRPDVVNFDAESTISRAHYAIDAVPNWIDDDTKNRLHNLLDRDDDLNSPLIARHILLTGSPEYREQFKQYAKNQYAGDLIRTAMSLTAGNGGAMVPHYLDPTIILTNAGVYAGTIRSLATVKTIATKAWEGVSSAGVSAAWTDEATSATDGSPTFASPTITAKKASAWLTGSYEVLQDSGFSSELGRLLADAKARLEEDAFSTGNTGATKPRGVVAAVNAVTASIVTSATTGALVIGDIYNLANAVNPRQEDKLAWLANKSIYSKIRQFDTSGGGGFWTNLNFGQPANLLGQPAMKSSAMTSVIGNGTNVLLAGDFSQYYIVDRIGMSVLYDPMVKTTASGAAPTGQAGWYAFWRVGADVVNADAFRILQLNQVAAAVALA